MLAGNKHFQLRSLSRPFSMVMAVVVALLPASAPAAAQMLGTAGRRPATSAAPGPAPSNGSSLVIEPAVEPVLADNFNPFDDKSPLGAMGAPSFVYEPLLEYNELQPNQYYPWLAQSWSFSTSGLTITFDLRGGVTWDDGSSLTANDVAYTFNLLRSNPAIEEGIPIVSAVATNPSTFTLTLSKPGYSYLYNIAHVPIVKAGFALGKNPLTYVVKQPDGTGPYILARPSDIDKSRAVLTARARYWQSGSPSVDKLVFPTFKNAAAAQAALTAGKIDWAGNFMPDVSPAFTQKDKSLNHFWAPSVDTIAMQPNLSRYPLDELPVREAVSVALSRQALSTSVTGGYDKPATSSSGLVVPLDDQYLSPASADDLGSLPQLSLAQRVMAAAGYKAGPRGYWESSSGQVVAFSISALSGTVYASLAQAVAAQLRSAGFDATTALLGPTAWAKALAEGNYDSTVSAGTAGPSPYYTYNAWLSSPAAASPRGKTSAATTKVANPAASALAQYQDNPTGSAQASAALSDVANYVTAQVAVVPLLYGAAWAEFTTSHASGWPDGSDPYEPASPSAPFDEYTVLQLTARG